jgi:hypothetical protein
MAYMMHREEEQRRMNYERRNENRQNINSHMNKVMLDNATTRQQLKEQTLKIREDIARAREDNQNMKNFNNTMNYTKAKEAKHLEQRRKAEYDQVVTESHNVRASELVMDKERHEQKIKQLEEIEQRMVQDLQRTLQRKNQAIDNLQEKSKGLKKVMQPRKAYKYGPPRGTSSDNLHANTQSAYSFTNDGFQNNLKGANAKINGIYGKRSNSI